jgi:hypothetical protein
MAHSITKFKESQITIAQNLSSTNPRDAERALQDIANTEGDKALAHALSIMESEALCKILIATATQNSAVTANLVPPNAFVNALCELPNQWNEESASRAIHDLNELFLGVVMRQDEEGTYGKNALPFIKAIEARENSRALLTWWIQQQDVDFFEEKLAQPDTSDEGMTTKNFSYHEGEWTHLLYLLKKRNSIVWQMACKEMVNFSDLLPKFILSNKAKPAFA